MKKLVISIVTVLFTLGFATVAFSQPCNPDQACIDTADPGQICPMEFPNGYVGVAYALTVTFIPPATYEAYGQQLAVQKIVINEVTGLPPGLEWDTDAEEFIPTEPITRYCGIIFGTPTQEGEYQFDFSATVTIDLMGGLDVPVTAEDLDYQPLLIIEAQENAPPVAEFSASETTVPGGTEVNFTDASFNAGAWEWTFEGGDPATSTEQNPTVTYNTEGIYDVTLEVTNTNTDDTDTFIGTDLITVTSTVHITPEFASRFKVFPNPTTNNFTVEGNEIMSLKVINSVGQVIFETNELANSIKVDVSNWSTGWYILEVNDGNTTVRANISVE
jgi:hypothetical protein